MTLPSRSPANASQESETETPIWGSRMGWLVGVDAAGQPLVDFDGNRAGPLAAKRTLPLEPQALRDAAERHQRAVLLFENGNPRLPLIVGLEQGSATPLLDALLEKAPAEPAPPEAQPAPPVTEAHVDGQRVVIEGQDEIVLQCGQASITLRRNGKVVIRGTYLETHSSGINRIKGGSVQVN